MAKTRTRKTDSVANVDYEVQVWQMADAPYAASDISAESAKLCGIRWSELVHRIARKESNAGIEFWGCSRFPSC